MPRVAAFLRGDGGGGDGGGGGGGPDDGDGDGDGAELDPRRVALPGPRYEAARAATLAWAPFVALLLEARTRNDTWRIRSGALHYYYDVTAAPARGTH